MKNQLMNARQKLKTKVSEISAIGETDMHCPSDTKAGELTQEFIQKNGRKCPVQVT